MTDDERAELLARAIDDLVSGIEEPAAPRGLDFEELTALLEIAEQRLALSHERQEEARAYERQAWQNLRGRLKPPQRPRNAPDIDIPRDQHEALRDIIALRLQMAREVLDIAESHKDEVWNRLKARMGPDWPPTNRAPSASETPIKPRNDAEVEAITRRSLSRLAEIAADPVNVRIRERMRRDVVTATPLPTKPEKRRWWMVAGLVATIALTAGLALPLPITGLDEHPALRLAESAAARLGMASSDANAGQS